jgi:transcriptional regulator GlxA family with amidase domain
MASLKTSASAPSAPPSFNIGIVVYDGVDMLDIAAPFEVFGWMASHVTKTLAVNVQYIAENPGLVTLRDRVQLSVVTGFATAPQLDLLWVPGGDPAALKREMAAPTTPYIAFLRAQARRARFVVSVCEGALLLARAGLLDGHRATTHWAFLPCLRRFKKIKVAPGTDRRFVVNKIKVPGGEPRYVVTGAGISSGLDESLELVKLIAGEATAEATQVSIQYFPDPPVSGKITPAKTCPFEMPGGGTVVRP